MTTPATLRKVVLFVVSFGVVRKVADVLGGWVGGWELTLARCLLFVSVCFFFMLFFIVSRRPLKRRGRETRDKNCVASCHVSALRRRPAVSCHAPALRRRPPFLCVFCVIIGVALAVLCTIFRRRIRLSLPTAVCLHFWFKKKK